jgi:hypothetical protein
MNIDADCVTSDTYSLFFQRPCLAEDSPCAVCDDWWDALRSNANFIFTLYIISSKNIFWPTYHGFVRIVFDL